MIIDSHVHLYVDAFAADLDEVMARAQAAGVQKFIIPGVDKASFEPMMNVVRRYPGRCFPCVGLHPTDVRSDWRNELAFMESRLQEKGFVAVGETGLDLHHSKDFVTEQCLAFEAQMRLSVQYDLPLIIHIREAFDVLFNVLDKVKGLPLRGVFHAFSGTTAIFERLRQYGHFKIGVGGVVTFKNAELANVVKNSELSDIILETDAPWLAPTPFRGQRNESSYLSYIVTKVAALRGCTKEEVEEAATRNTTQLFHI
jgi:TatD DNase family protein